MADDEAQGQEDPSWPALEAFTDSSLPSAFDEPLVWPESGTWDAPPTGGPEADPRLLAEHRADLDGGPLFPPAPEDSVIEHGPLPDLDVQWQAIGHDDDTTVHHGQALGGLGGGAELAASVDSGPAVERLPESIWSPPGANGDIGLISTSALPTPPVYPAAERSPEGPLWRRFDLRQGNAAMVALISAVSLVLLGMFLSVRARNDLPTDSSQSRRPSNEISVTGSLNTIPLTTTVTTTAPAAAINIADLLPAAEADVEPTGDAPAADAGSASGSGSGSGSPATTATPARRTGPSGGGGSTTPAAAPAAAKAPAPTSPPVTPAPVDLDDTTTPPDTFRRVDTTQPRRPSATFTVPVFPTTSTPEDDTPSYSVPSWPGTRD